MKNHSQKLQLKLTLEFSLFFIIISVFIYFYTTTKFEDQLVEKYRYKAFIFNNYLEQNPQIFVKKKFADKESVKNLLDLNDGIYLVVENNSGEVFDAINLELAEKNFYILAKKDYEGISKDENIFSIVLPVSYDKNPAGKIYVGFDSRDDARNLFKNKLLTALFSLLILSAGIVFTYFLSSISFRPLNKIIKKLDAISNSKSEKSLTDSHKDQLGVLEDRVDIVLSELDKSTSEVESLNKKLHDVFKDKISELNFEINQRKKAEISLQKSEEQFRLVFQNAPIGIVIISREGKILSVNKSFCDTLGYSREEIISIPIKHLFDNNDLEGFSAEGFDYNGTPVADINTQKVLYKREGTEIDVIVKSVSILDEFGKVKHYVMQILDISEIKKVQNELVTALNKAEESDRLKSAFLAQMSHEIRTPLNVILTSIPLLADEVSGDDEELKIIFDSVKSAGKRLQRTIDMILSMSSVQSGNYKPSFESFNLVTDLQNMLNEFKSLSDDKGLELKFRTDGNEAFIVADRYTVNQVFQNIINNAIKYTLKGYVEISVKTLKSHKIDVEIRDSGIGMGEEYLRNIFSPFSQEDVGHKRQFEGNGLGLALVKKYIELNHAQINVESEKNKGSVFLVTFDKDLKSSRSSLLSKEYKELN
ncbi:MAG: PAS domain-containing sensor histidine kinase [Ignavibacteriaceae bacterium]